MFGSEMRGALYNSATRGQPDGVVQPHEDPKTSVLMKSARNNKTQHRVQQHLS